VVDHSLTASLTDSCSSYAHFFCDDYVLALFSHTCMYVLWWPGFGLFFWTNDQVLVSFFFFWTNDQVLVSLNAHVHILFNHDISNLLPFARKIFSM
jgi:hypothetical protein